MPLQWGVDSYDPINTSYYGTTLANYVINDTYASAHMEFWGRYFSGEGPGDFTGNGEAVALLNAITSNGQPQRGWILPLSDDNTGTIATGSVAQGTNAGNAFCQNTAVWIDDCPNMSWPGDGQLYGYLDIENTYSPYLSPNYWDGWWLALWNFEVWSGYYPFYPAAYADPWLGGQVCGMISGQGWNGVGENRPAYSLWSYEPQTGPGCVSPGPSWNPSTCQGILPDAWQYWQGCLGSPGPIDLDCANRAGGPYGNGLMDYLIYCS
jgi:hypothetical protein